VNQQVAQLHIGIAHVGAKNIFAKEIVELSARRMLFKELTVLMPRAGEGVVFHLDILA
jgi:hypothetical protein